MDASKEIVYQIYPRSFQDSNQDGIGDLKGIISRLDYLQKLGITMIWMNPVYPSPQNDNGYDVADYTAIDPMYGTMEDMEELIKEAGRRGIGIMFDMVFNHTSTSHEWFKKALKNDPEYKDFYIWKKAKPDGGIPNNWESKFGGPVWEYVKDLDEYYLHLFDPTQADLNWENPKVRERLAGILQFWLDKGIRGFRFDVINLISKDSFEDDLQGVGKRFYTDGKNVPVYLHELYEKGMNRPDVMTVGEMSATSIENCAEYTKPENEELTMAFNFHHLKVDYKDKEKWTLADFDFMELKELFNEWDVKMEQLGGWNALFWNCHDQPRALSRFGDDQNYPEESARMLANVIFTRRGTPYLLYGDEIGMTNNYFTKLDQYRDVESLNYYEILKEEGKDEQEILEILSAKSRDNGRSCMQWNAEKNAGFCEDQTTPWMEVNPNHVRINAEAAQNEPDSIFAHYQKLIKIRKNDDIIQHGSTIPVLEKDPNIYGYKRVLEKNGRTEEILCLHNFYGREAPVDLENLKDYELIISSYPDYSLESNPVLRPYESVVLKKRSKSLPQEPSAKNSPAK